MRYTERMVRTGFVLRAALCALVCAAAVCAHAIPAHAAATLAAPNTNALSSGLVGYWPLDGVDTDWTAGTTLDLSGQGNTGTIDGIVSTDAVPGKIGQAFNFHDSSNVQHNGGAVLQITGSVTVSAWVKSADFSDRGSSSIGEAIAGYGADNDVADGSNNVLYLLGINGSKHLTFFWEYGGGINAAVQSSIAAPVNAGEWHHYVAVRAWNGSTNTVTFYVDGQQLGTAQTNANQATGGTTSTGFEIGKLFGSTSYQFDGAIDDVRVYNTALTSTQVALLYAAGQAHVGSVAKNALTSGLVGYWTMDGSRTHWNTGTEDDSSGNGNTGMLVNMSTSSSPVAGKINQALSFNGSNTGISIPDASVLDPGTSSFTVSAWVKENAFTSGNVIAAKSDGGSPSSSYGWHLAVFAGNVAELHFATGGAFTTITNSTTLTTGMWYHIVAVVDRSNISNSKIYFNGSSAGSSVSDGGNTGSITNAVPLAIGTESDGGFNWNGPIDDVRIYNRALSAQEVAMLYAAGAATVGHSNTSAISSGLTGYWTFDGPKTHWDTGVEDDASGSGNAGTLVNLSTTTSPTPGVTGQALNFNGSNSYVSIPATAFPGYPTSGSTSAYNFAVSLWFKTKSPGAILGQTSNCSPPTVCSGYVPALYIGTDGKLRASAFWHNNTGSQIVTPSTLTDGKWHHVVDTYSAGTERLYLDDALIGSQSVLEYGFSTLYQYFIGAAYEGSWPSAPGGWDYFDGSIDDVRVYSRALSASEISELYDLGH